jgi:hypothetical protein
MSDGVAQLAFVSAVLGGFAVTFLAVLLTLTQSGRHLSSAIVVTIGSAASFLIATLGWGLMAFVLSARESTSDHSTGGLQALQSFGRLHEGLTASFLLGSFLLLVTLGLSGWIRSRRVGMMSTGIAFVAALICVAILRQFIVQP